MYLDCYYYHQFFFAAVAVVAVVAVAVAAVDAAVAVDSQMYCLKSGWLMNFPVHFELLNEI